MKRRGLRLSALDTLFFRDGRPFDAANRVTSVLPTPQTTAGAIRTALLAATNFDFERFRATRRHTPILEALSECNADQRVTSAQFKGPWLGVVSTAKNGQAYCEPYLPCPQTLRRSKDGAGWVFGLPVDPPDGWKNEEDPESAKPLEKVVCYAEDFDAKAELPWISLTGITKFLHGQPPAIEDCRCIGSLMSQDSRVGIGIDGERLVTIKGELYAIGLSAFGSSKDKAIQDVELYVEIEADESLVQLIDELSKTGLTFPLGGEGKYVAVTTQEVVDWPTKSHGASNSLHYLATPTFLAPNTDKFGCNRPLPDLDGLVAAASGGPLPVSGWDVARNCPRPTRFAVPAGAVYFYEKPVDKNAFLYAADADELRQEGWGFTLQGTWSNQA